MLLYSTITILLHLWLKCKCQYKDVQYTVIPSAAYGFITGMNHQLCLSHGHGEVIGQQ